MVLNNGSVIHAVMHITALSTPWKYHMYVYRSWVSFNTHTQKLHVRRNYDHIKFMECLLLCNP